MVFEITSRSSIVSEWLRRIGVPHTRVSDIGPKNRESAQWLGSSQRIYGYEALFDSVEQLKELSHSVLFSFYWNIKGGYSDSGSYSEHGFRDGANWSRYRDGKQVEDGYIPWPNKAYKTPGCGMN